MSNINTSLDDILEAQDKEFESKLLKRERKHQQNLKMLEGKNLGRWGYEEHLKYYIFLAINEKLFENTNLNRNNKVFKMMSKHIPSRTSQQCRSHHQKIKAKWRTVSLILENLAIEFGGMNMKQILQNYDAFSLTNSSSCVERLGESNQKKDVVQSLRTKESIQTLPSQNQQQIYDIQGLDQQFFNYGPSNDLFENSFHSRDSLFDFM